MRQIIVFNRISLDGFFAGPNGEIDWFIRDADLDAAIHGAGSSDMLLMGRLTYQMFEAVWPKMAADPNAPRELRDTGQELNEMTKVVFSRTLKAVTWVNSRLLPGDVADEARKLKEGDGSAILIFGSGSIVQQLAPEGLIDEYYLAVTPVILGAGKAMFAGVGRQNLKRVDSQAFASGNVLLHYRT
jgi:dihydrofolate reductase